MKDEYLEPKISTTTSSISPPHHHQPPSSLAMFSKLHHHHHHPGSYSTPPSLHQPFPFQAVVTRECQTPEEETTSRSSGGLTPTTTTALAVTTTSPSASKRPRVPSDHHQDGSSIEVAKRPRGRPPGSKNKPKPPVFITREPEPVMSPYILEIPNSLDVIEALSRYTHRRNLGLCVMTGSGTVSNVTLRQPGPTPGSTVTFHGRFEILSLSATFLNQASSLQIPLNIAISLAGPSGQVVGGSVAGPLVAVGSVYIVAASFNSPVCHRLGGEDEVKNSGSSGNNNDHDEEQSPGSGGGGEKQVVSGDMYSCGGLQGDVIWARQPPQQQPPPPPY